MRHQLLYSTSKLYLRLVSIVLGFLMLCPSTLMAEEIFGALTSNKNVESSYVSGRMAENMKTWKGVSDRSTVNLNNGFSSLYSYRCFSVDAVNEARKILNDYLKRNSEVELIMRTKELSGEYMFYERFNSSNQILQMIIWNATEPSDCEIVVIDFTPGSSQRATITGENSSAYSGNYNQPRLSEEEYQQTLQRLREFQVREYLKEATGQTLEGYTLEGDWSAYGISTKAETGNLTNTTPQRTQRTQTKTERKKK